MGREEEEAVKAQKDGRGRRELAVAVEIVRKSEEKVARPGTRDGDDGDLKMRDQDVTLEPA